MALAFATFAANVGPNLLRPAGCLFDLTRTAASGAGDRGFLRGGAKVPLGGSMCTYANDPDRNKSYCTFHPATVPRSVLIAGSLMARSDLKWSMTSVGRPALDRVRARPE